MIVICTKCQAKFRVADEKIGPRGAKVRCSKCQTVFLVHPDLGTIPVTDGDARPAVAKPAAAPPPVPPPAAFSEPEPPPFDPFGGADPFAAPPPAAPDPFAAAPAADPFAIPPAPDPFAPSAADPFAPRPPPPLPSAARDPFGSDPFAAPPPPAPGLAGDAGDAGDPFAAPSSPRSTLPVTDLSDLLGGGAPGAPPAPAPAPAPASDPFDAVSFAPEPAAAAPALGGSEPADDGGLALEDRLTPPPVHVKLTPPPDEEPLETADPAQPGPQFDPFATFVPVPAAGLAAEPFLDGTEARPPDAAEPSFELAGAAAPVSAPRPAAPRAAPARPGSEAAAAAATAPEAAERIPGARTSRLRAVAVNAVALVALLVVALTLWALWRTEGPIEAASFRPSAILAALGRGGARGGPWAAHDVRSGFYDRERGAPLLFVRGRVVSRATSAVSAVKVDVEVVRDGQVLARGEAIAGAVPTAEELYGAADDAALSAAVRAARARAPAQIRPGDAVPFLVAIGGASTELEGATLRIGVAPAPGGAP